MAKRFTDTNKWKDEWYGSLSNDYRIVWQYLLDNCDNAGIMKKDFRLLNFQCNVNLTESDLIRIFDTRIISFSNFYFIPKFVKFQYSKGLNSNKPAIVSVRERLHEMHLSEIIIELYGNDYLIIDESLSNDNITIKDKDKDKDQDKDQDKEGLKESVKTIKGNSNRLTSLENLQKEGLEKKKNESIGS